jgi:hypothetical protein
MPLRQRIGSCIATSSPPDFLPANGSARGRPPSRAPASTAVYPEPAPPRMEGPSTRSRRPSLLRRAGGSSPPDFLPANGTAAQAQPAARRVADAKSAARGESHLLPPAPGHIATQHRSLSSWSHLQFPGKPSPTLTTRYKRESELS